MIKQETIAGTMRAFMATGPKVSEFKTYRALNDHVGKIHGLADGKCQALAGEKAWVWYPDQITDKWRPATEEEIASKREKAARKAHGSRKAKIMSKEDREALDAQVTALITVNNPALAPLLEDLKAKQAADDIAKKGSLRDRLAAAVNEMGLETAVWVLEDTLARYKAAKAAKAATEKPGDGTPEE